MALLGKLRSTKLRYSFFCGRRQGRKLKNACLSRSNVLRVPPFAKRPEMMTTSALLPTGCYPATAILRLQSLYRTCQGRSLQIP